nr:hypothetical protein TGCOUG_239748B [Toxoplasma gondii COUG]
MELRLNTPHCPPPGCALLLGVLLLAASLLAVLFPSDQVSRHIGKFSFLNAISATELPQCLKLAFSTSLGPHPAWRAVASAVFPLCGLAAGVAVVFFLFRRPYIVEQSLEIVANFGVQLQQKTRWGGIKRQFIDASQVSDVIINEGFRACDVVFYVALLVKDQPSMVVPFQHFPLPLEENLVIYETLHHLLHISSGVRRA